MVGSWRGQIGVALVWAALSVLPAHAQSDSAALRSEFESLFQQLLTDPSNEPLNRRFIEVALLLDDPEAAIGALERLLFYDPNDPAINYQLGTLYLQVGAAVVAQTFFEAALANETITPILRSGAEAGLAKAKRAAEPSPWSGYVQIGGRYQTNANVAPSGIDQAGGEVATPDFNGFGLATLSYAKPVEGAILEARFTAYYAEQLKVDRLDFGFGEVQAGPRIFLHQGETSSLAIKPYGLANGVLLGDDPYQASLGGGVQLRAVLSEMLALTPYFEYRDRDYFNSDDYPNATDEIGHIVTFGIMGDGTLGEAVSWTSDAGLNENDARVADNSYDEYFADMSLIFAFNRATEGAGEPWTFSPFGGVSLTDYWAPEPGETSKREDFRWKAGASLDVPVTERIGLGMQVQYTVNDSNIDRFDYKNLQVSSGPRLRF